MIRKLKTTVFLMLMQEYAIPQQYGIGDYA